MYRFDVTAIMNTLTDKVMCLNRHKGIFCFAKVDIYIRQLAVIFSLDLFHSME